MPQPSLTLLEPRKSPVQARSTASVDAILEATTQVLLQTGKERLTTTRVAARAGVSIGTLYQYFPNKSALLQGALGRHFDGVTAAVEGACLAHHGCSLACMAEALVTAYLQAKMKDPQTSVALYAVGSDVDGIKLAKQVAVRTHAAIARMLRTAPSGQLTDPDLAATVLQGAIAGVSRRLVESAAPEALIKPLRGELIVMFSAYLKCSSQGQEPTSQDTAR